MSAPDFGHRLRVLKHELHAELLAHKAGLNGVEIKPGTLERQSVDRRAPGVQIHRHPIPGRPVARRAQIPDLLVRLRRDDVIKRIRILSLSHFPRRERHPRIRGNARDRQRRRVAQIRLFRAPRRATRRSARRVRADARDVARRPSSLPRRRRHRSDRDPDRDAHRSHRDRPPSSPRAAALARALSRAVVVAVAVARGVRPEERASRAERAVLDVARASEQRDALDARHRRSFAVLVRGVAGDARRDLAKAVLKMRLWCWRM